MFCTNCGKKVYDGDRFCAHCGTRVREEAPAPRPVSQDIVFNPPFKVEAERRTSEIFRGFASEKPAEEKPRQTEPVSFDWNLDGFPKESRKTEDVDFNWGSVIEKRNQQRSGSSAPVVDKIDLRGLQEHAEENVPEEKPAVSEPLEITEKEEEPVRVRIPLFVESDYLTPKSVVETHEPEIRWDTEEIVLEEPASAEIPNPEPELIYVSEIPELILPEDPAEPEISAAPEADADPEVKAEPEVTETAAAEVPHEAEEPVMSIEELEAEIFGKNYKGIGSMAPEEAVKSTAQLEKFYTYNKKNEEFQLLLDQEYERLLGMEEARRADTESLEFTWAGKLFPERREETPAEDIPAEDIPEEKIPEEKPAIQGDAAPAEKKPEPVSDATIDFSAVREEARQKKQKAELDAAAKNAAAEIPVKSEVPETSETPEAPEVQEVSEEKTAEEKEPVSEETPEEISPSQQEEKGCEPEHDEKAKLRYSDIFPREKLGDGGNDDAASAAVNAAKVLEALEEDDEEYEPKKMNFFVKLIVLILTLLILAEGVILLAKLIAPESAFSQKADMLVESIMDRITGGDGGAVSGDDEGGETDEMPVSGDEPELTYISDILAEKIEVPDSIGEILEDSGLRYDLSRTYACEEVADTAVFEDGTWKTTADGETVTYAEGILDTIVSYYGHWQATNQDTSLIGINKLEIGEIRTGEMGYYVLCRLTFAAADGEDVVKYVTACVKISQDSMVNNKIEEEKL